MSLRTLPSSVGASSIPPTPSPAEKRRSPDWGRNPTLDERLFDWLDQHPREKKALLRDPISEIRSSRAWKYDIKCCKAVVADVFCADPDPDIQEWAKRDPLSFAMAIRRRLLSLQASYKYFISVVGREIANMTTAQIRENGKDRDGEVARAMRKFPQWGRMHGYWRTIGRLNRFYLQSESHSSQKKSIKLKESTRRPDGNRVAALSFSSSDDDGSSSSTENLETADEQDNHKISSPNRDKISNAKCNMSVKSKASQREIPVLAPQLGPQDIIELTSSDSEDGDNKSMSTAHVAASALSISNAHSSQLSLKRKRATSEPGHDSKALVKFVKQNHYKPSRDSLAPEQAHEIRMEELRIKRAKIESVDKEKERETRLRIMEIEERLQTELIKDRREKRELIRRVLAMLEDE